MGMDGQEREEEEEEERLPESTQFANEYSEQPPPPWSTLRKNTPPSPPTPIPPFCDTTAFRNSTQQAQMLPGLCELSFLATQESLKGGVDFSFGKHSFLTH